MSKNIVLRIRKDGEEYDLSMDGKIGDIEGKMIDGFFNSINHKHEVPVKDSPPENPTKEEPKEKKVEKDELKNDAVLSHTPESSGVSNKEEESHADISALKSFFDNGEHLDPNKPDSFASVDDLTKEEDKVKNNHTNKKDNKEEDPEHWKTGIIKREGYNGEEIRLYKCRYWCADCKSSKNQYIEIDSDEVECRDCDNIMEVEVATDISDGSYKGYEVPGRDSFGNFFVARNSVFED